VDGGTENLRVTLAAIISTDLRWNEPRYVRATNIMKAIEKPLETLKREDLDVDVVSK
jgi:electron transfer flavoprotein beta subunit